MKLLPALCFLLCTGCARYTGNYLGKLLDEAQLALNQGDLPRSLRLSERGQQFSLYSGNSGQLWNFRCIRAESYGAQRDWTRAAAVLSERLPAQLAAGQVAARVQIDRGAAQTWLGNLARAQEYFNNAAALCAKPENSRLLGELNLRLAGFAYRKRDLAQAESLAHEAVTFARQHDQPYLEASAMTFLGALLSNAGRWGQAVSWLQPATDAARRLSIKTSLEKNLGNLAWCYYNLGDDQAALADFVQAERGAGEISNLDDRRQWLTDIGAIYEDRDDYSKAASFHLRALNIATQANQPIAIATSLHNLAIDAFNRDDFVTAKKYNDEEMRLKRQSGNLPSELYGRYLEGHIQRSQNNHPAAIAIFEEIARKSGDNLSLRWQSQVWCARVHEADHEPELAQRDFDAALQTFNQARRQAGRDEFRITLRSALNRYYSDYIHFLVRQGKSLEALNIAETSRAQVLSERLGVESNSGFTLARAQATAAALQAVILSYWLTPEGSYLWVITPTSFATIPLPPGPVISNLADSCQRAIASSSSKFADTRLYETLIAPAQQYIPKNGRVVVIPDGALYQINFETLLVPSEPEPHYWIEDAVLSTATSLALLSVHPHTGVRGNVLLIGNPVSPVPEFPTLPYAAAELHSIADRFPVAQRTVFEGPQARPSAYLAANPGAYSWIHFAAHGVASKESPLDSAIVLSNEGDSFKLYARDIAKLPLKADLVTISACYGSGTRTFAGEGIVGLAWAFLLAGAHNVVASLWEANDYYTAQLMDVLYVRLQSGDDAAHALRTAKLSLLHSEYVCRNPRYWGAFQLYTGY